MVRIKGAPSLPDENTPVPGRPDASTPARPARKVGRPKGEVPAPPDERVLRVLGVSLLVDCFNPTCGRSCFLSGSEPHYCACGVVSTLAAGITVTVTATTWTPPPPEEIP